MLPRPGMKLIEEAMHLRHKFHLNMRYIKNNETTARCCSNVTLHIRLKRKHKILVSGGIKKAVRAVAQNGWELFPDSVDIDPVSCQKIDGTPRSQLGQHWSICKIKSRIIN